MTNRVIRRGRMLARQVADGDAAGVRNDVRRWIWSETTAVGFRFDSGADNADPPPPKIPLVARLLDAPMAAKVFDFEGLGANDRLYLERRRAMYDAGFEGGWVAVDEHGNPAYLQWLVPQNQAAKMAAFFGPLFPEAGPETLLVEGAWIPPAFRKQRVMGEGLALVTQAALGATPDARYAECFITSDNGGAMRGTHSAGYEVNRLRTDYWRLGRRTVDFRLTASGELDHLVI